MTAPQAVAKYLIGAFLTVSFCVSLFGQAIAEQCEGASAWKRFSLNFGYFFSDQETELRFNSGQGVDAVIDLETVFNLDEKLTSPRLDAVWRFADRHSVHVTCFRQERQASRVIDTDVLIQGITFAVNTTVDTLFDVTVYKGGYSYAFFQDDRIELALSPGVHVLQAKLSLSSPLTGTVISEDITAPMIGGGLRTGLAITPKCHLHNRIEYFFISPTNYKGHSVVAGIDLQYDILKHFGIGIGYEYASIFAEEDGANLLGGYVLGDLEYEYSGLKSYVSIFF